MIKKSILIPVIAIVAIVPIVFLLVSGSIFNQAQNNILLNQTVTLTSTSYEKKYYLSLKQGDKVQIQVSVTGEPIDFQVAKDEPFELLVDNTDILSFNQQLTIPSDGTYVFYVGTMGDHATVHLTVTKV
jgi:hypothetical protein